MNKVKQIGFDNTLQDFLYNYSIDVIEDRTIPTLVDGLKPVARRILYDMYQTGVTSTSPYKKVMSVVGDTMGKYHPHGDSGIYDALVNMGSNYKTLCMPIDGHGNYGSTDDNAASGRYIECRLSKFAENVLLKDMSPETVPYVRNFSDEHDEPTLLPAVLPNILLYPNHGVAVGYKCDYLPHNPRDVINLCIEYVKNRNMSIDEMCNILKAPDFPSGGEIHGIAKVHKAYKTGIENIKVRGTYTIEMMNGYPTIIINSLPYGMPIYMKDDTLGAIAKINKMLIEPGKLNVKYIGDESDKTHPVRIVIQLKKDDDPMRVVNLLMTKECPVLETGIFMCHYALVGDKKLKLVTLKDIMASFVEFREETLNRKFKEELKKKNHSINILEGLFKVSNQLDKAIAMIRQSNDEYEVLKAKFMKTFDLNNDQAEYILHMQLRRLSGLDMTDYEKEYKDLKERVKVLVKITATKSNADIDAYMISEWTKLQNKLFNDKIYDRRTKIVETYNKVSKDVTIKEADCSIIRSSLGYLKRVNPLGENTRGRGTQGFDVSTGAEDDAIAEILNTKTTADIFAITSRGKIYKEIVNNIPFSNNKGRGTLSRNIFKIQIHENVVRMFTTDDINKYDLLTLVTEQGMVKCIKLSDILNTRGRRLIDISNTDKVVAAIPSNSDDNLLIASRDGMALYTALSNFRVSSAGSGGVKSIKLANKDRVVSAVIAKDDDQIIVISTNGFGKRIKISDFNTKGRVGAGVNIAPKDKEYGDIADVCVAQDVLTILTKQGKCLSIKTDDIRLTSRASKGVKSINLLNDDTVETIV